MGIPQVLRHQVDRQDAKTRKPYSSFISSYRPSQLAFLPVFGDSGKLLPIMLSEPELERTYYERMLPVAQRQINRRLNAATTISSGLIEH
jgi:hypothetical protein